MPLFLDAEYSFPLLADNIKLLKYLEKPTIGIQWLAMITTDSDQS